MPTQIETLREHIKAQGWKGWRITEPSWYKTRGKKVEWCNATKRWPNDLTIRLTGSVFQVALEIENQEGGE